MRLKRFLLPLTGLVLSTFSIGYASWQFNDGGASFGDTLLGITSNWRLSISMSSDGQVYDGEGHVGHVVYEDENYLAGGTITSDFVILDNNEAAASNYVASQLGSKLHLFNTTSVYWNLPKAIVDESTGEEIPVVGVDHLGTYTTIGGPLHRRYVYCTIPEGYTFLGNYAFYLMGSDHADSFIEFNIPSTVTYIGHEAFNFSTLNQMKSMRDQKYKFRVNYGGTAKEFLELIENSKRVYEEKYVGVGKDEMEKQAVLFQKEVDDTGGIIYSGSTEYSWFFRPAGQSMSSANDSYWPAQYDYIDVYCSANTETGKKEVVRFHANSPIADECKARISYYKEVASSNEGPVIYEIDE